MTTPEDPQNSDAQGNDAPTEYNPASGPQQQPLQAYGETAYSGQTQASYGEPYQEQQYYEQQHAEQYADPNQQYGYVGQPTDPQNPYGYPTGSDQATTVVPQTGNDEGKAVRRWQIIAALGVGAAALIGLSFILFGSLSAEKAAPVTTTVTDTETARGESSVITRNRTETSTVTEDRTETQNRTATVTRTVTRPPVTTTVTEDPVTVTTTVTVETPAAASP